MGEWGVYVCMCTQQGPILKDMVRLTHQKDLLVDREGKGDDHTPSDEVEEEGRALPCPLPLDHCHREVLWKGVRVSDTRDEVTPLSPACLM